MYTDVRKSIHFAGADGPIRTNPMISLPATPGRERPKYEQIASDLTDRIRSGEYPAGKLLPTLTQLGERYAVSQITVRHAVRLLVDLGLVKTVPGKGTFAISDARRETRSVEHRVGVLLPTIRGWSALTPALFEALHALGHDILMKPLPMGTDFASEPDRALFELEALRATCGSGLIMFGDRFLVEAFLRERRPHEVGVCLENSNGIPSTVPMVTGDGFSGTFGLTRHLLALGHTRIAYLEPVLLSEPGSDRMQPGTTREQRFAGYRAALCSAGLAPCVPHDLVDTLLHSPGPQELVRLFRRPEMPTALLCFNDTIAVQAYDRLTEAGIAVPAEISLAGYDNVSALLGHPSLTSVDQNGPELARQMVRLLHGERERLQHRREEAGPRILVPPVLHIRDSIAPPAA